MKLRRLMLLVCEKKIELLERVQSTRLGDGWWLSPNQIGWILKPFYGDENKENGRLLMRWIAWKWGDWCCNFGAGRRLMRCMALKRASPRNWMEQKMGEAKFWSHLMDFNFSIQAPQFVERPPGPQPFPLPHVRMENLDAFAELGLNKGQQLIKIHLLNSFFSWWRQFSKMILQLYCSISACLVLFLLTSNPANAFHSLFHSWLMQYYCYNLLPFCFVM